MTLHAAASAAIAASPQTILEFVLDLERYREADHKITRVSSVVGPDELGNGSARLWGRLPGLPPAPDRQDFVLERWERVTFTGARRQPGRVAFDFVGTFECVPTSDTITEVTHAYRFDFRRGFHWVERRLEGALQSELDREVERLASILGAPSMA